MNTPHTPGLTPALSGSRVGPRPVVSVVIALFCAARIAAASVDSAPVLTLEAALAEVRARHPALEAARLAADAAGELATVEGAWEDPRVALTFEREGTRRPTTFSMAELEISQALPLSGRNRARADVARAEAGEMLADLPLREVELLSEAVAAYFGLATTDEEIELLDRNAALMAAVRDNLRQRYEASRSTLADVLAAETELAMLAERRLSLTGRRASAQERLNALMIRPAGTALPRALAPDIPGELLALTHFLDIARNNSPLIARAEQRTAVAESRATLARLNRRLDPEVMLAMRKHNSSGRLVEEYDTGVAFSLPWANPRKLRAERTAATRAVAAAESEHAAALQEVLGRVASAWHELEAFRDCCLVFRDSVIPLARQTVDAAQRSFETGQTPVGDLLDAHRRLLEAESGYIDRRREYYDGVIALQNATGVINPKLFIP